MKFSVVSVVSIILSAGFAISLASAAPIRIVVVSEPVSSTTSFIRVGHAAAAPHFPYPNVATLHPVSKVHMKSKHGCAGSFRAKAMQISNWFKLVFRLRPVDDKGKAVVVTNGDSNHHQTNVHHSTHAQTFVQRLTRALMMLGPWEGRAVSFILGCGIGVLIRMFWVLAVLAIRSARGKRREEEFLGDEVIFEEEEHLLPPPQYVVKEKSVPIEAA